MKKSVLPILFFVLAFCAGSAGADGIVLDPPGLNTVSDLAHQVCGVDEGLGLVDVVNTWNVAKPPLFGTPTVGDFANPTRDCRKTCKSWVKGCQNAVSGFGKCISQTAVTAVKQVQEECRTRVVRAEKTACLQLISAELKVVQADTKADVKNTTDIFCKAELEQCIDDCVDAVTPP